jgi:hypothetical protein
VVARDVRRLGIDMASIADLAACAHGHLDTYCDGQAYARPAYGIDPHPTLLTAIDLLAPALLNARVSWNAALAMANSGDSDDDPPRELWNALAAVVEDTRAHSVVFDEIEDLESDELWMKAHVAFEVCQDVSGVKTTKVSKILHRKLPDLVPINDRLVRNFYGVKRNRTWSLWPALHDDIAANRAQVDTLRSKWSLPDGRPMSRLRCADIAIWMHVKSGCG